MMGVRTIFIAGILLLLSSATPSFALTCKGVWQNGGSVKVAFLKNNRIKYCDGAKCLTSSYSSHFRSDVISFLAPDRSVSVVVSWIDGKYLISKKPGRFSRTIYAPLACRK